MHVPYLSGVGWTPDSGVAEAQSNVGRGSISNLKCRRSIPSSQISQGFQHFYDKIHVKLN